MTSNFTSNTQLGQVESRIKESRGGKSSNMLLPHKATRASAETPAFLASSNADLSTDQ